MLTFNEADHAYFWNGARVPGVSEIMADMVPPSFFVTPEDLEKSRKLGNAVHKAIEYSDRKVAFQSDPLIDPWLEAWRLFKKHFDYFEDIIIDGNVIIEGRFFSEVYGFAGTTDRVYFNPRTQAVIIIDWKTGAVSRRWSIQGAGYEKLVREKVTKYRKFERWAVRLVPGKYELILPKNDFRHDFNIFNALLISYRWKKEGSI